MALREKKQYQIALIKSQQNAKNANKFQLRNTKYFLLFAIDEVDDTNIDADCNDQANEFEPINGKKDRK